MAGQIKERKFGKLELLVGRRVVAHVLNPADENLEDYLIFENGVIIVHEVGTEEGAEFFYTSVDVIKSALKYDEVDGMVCIGGDRPSKTGWLNVRDCKRIIATYNRYQKSLIQT